MNKVERVLNAMNNRPVDRPPVGFWHHFEGADMAENFVNAQVQYYRDSQTDFIKVMSDGIPYTLNATITCASDWRKVTPQGKNSAFFRQTLERCKRLSDALQGECCTFYNIFSPYNVIREAFENADATVMAHLQEDPDAVNAAARAVGEDEAELAQALIQEGGMTGIYQSFQAAELDRFTAEEYRAWVRPSDLMVLTAANEAGGLNIGHYCSWWGRKNRLEDWQDYPAQVVNWGIYIEGMSLQDGRAFFGDKPVLGGFDNRKCGLLYTGSKEEIQAETRRIAAAIPVGLTVGADCTVPMDIDLERIRWVVEALEGLAK